MFDHDTGKQATEDAQKQRVCRTVHNVKEFIFTSVGTAHRAVDAVTGLLSTPEVRELQHAEYWFDAIGDVESSLLKNDRAAIPLITANVRPHTNVFSSAYSKIPSGATCFNERRVSLHELPHGLRKLQHGPSL